MLIHAQLFLNSLAVHVCPCRVQRGNKIIRYLCILIGVLGGALSGYMLSMGKAIRKVVDPVENKVQVIGQAISEIEGKKDSPMAFTGSRY